MTRRDFLNKFIQAAVLFSFMPFISGRKAHTPRRRGAMYYRELAG